MAKLLKTNDSPQKGATLSGQTYLSIIETDRNNLSLNKKDFQKLFFRCPSGVQGITLKPYLTALKMKREKTGTILVLHTYLFTPIMYTNQLVKFH